MSKTIQVDGVRFESAAAIAARFGYDNEYVVKLAQSGEVVASKVGEMWFVDPRSFALQLEQSEGQKKEQLEKIERQRKLKTEAANLVPSSLELERSFDRVELSGHSLALAQTVLVLTCGLFAGGLGYFMYEQQTSITDLTDGVGDITEQFSNLMIPSGAEESVAAAIPFVPIAVPDEEGADRFADLPIQDFSRERSLSDNTVTP